MSWSKTMTRDLKIVLARYHSQFYFILVEWFFVGIIQNIKAPLRIHEVTSYEEELKKYQQIEINDN